MSTTSSASTIVSFRGEELELEQALDKLYRDIQENLNISQCSVRQLAVIPEQDDDFLEAAKVYLDIEGYVEMLLKLFKELRAVSKQVLGPCPKELKVEFADLLAQRKEEAAQEKEKAKLEALAAKAAEMSI